MKWYLFLVRRPDIHPFASNSNYACCVVSIYSLLVSAIFNVSLPIHTHSIRNAVHDTRNSTKITHLHVQILKNNRIVQSVFKYWYSHYAIQNMKTLCILHIIEIVSLFFIHHYIPWTTFIRCYVRGIWVEFSDFRLNQMRPVYSNERTRLSKSIRNRSLETCDWTILRQRNNHWANLIDTRPVSCSYMIEWMLV